MRLIDADALLTEYDRVHVGEPGNARKLIENAPTVERRGSVVQGGTGMTKNVAYKQCVCDICKHETNIASSLDLPDGWGRLKLSMLIDMDVCESCAVKITKYVDNMIQHYREEREQP